MAHVHDTNGGHTDHETVIGNEIVKYRVYKCSCGKVSKNVVIKRKPLKF